MLIICAICKKNMGELSGRIVKGWLVVHETCLSPRQTKAPKDDSGIEFLMDILRGRK